MHHTQLMGKINKPYMKEDLNFSNETTSIS